MSRVAIVHTQNLCLRSNDFSNASWVKANCSFGAPANNPITGAADAAAFIDSVDGAPAVHFITEGTTPARAGEIDCNYTVRVFAKNIDATRPVMLLAGMFLAGSGTYFNLVTGVKTDSGTNITSAMLAVPGQAGWYQCIVTGPSDTTRALTVFSATAVFGTSYQGTGSACFYIYEVGIAQANGWAGPITNTTGAIVDTGPIRSLP